jgi:P2 family phage contractile tail tube protein
MNRFLVMEHVNLFCGKDPGSDVSNHLILTDLQLPHLTERYIDHTPGGAAVAVEFDVIIQHLEAHFKLAGVQPQVMKLLHPYTADQTAFTALGFVRDPMDGTYTQAVAHITGRLGSVEPDTWRRGTTFATSYAIRGIIKYGLQVAGFGNVITWDFMNNLLFVG